jgi:UDP-glucose 4-epimerase
MQVLVTGGAGFIGSHVVQRLLETGSRVRVLDNLSTGRRENLEVGGGGAELVVGDVAEQQLVERCAEGCGAIIHLAAVASVQASIETPGATHRSNFDGTLNLLEAARRQGVRRFLYASSAAVYGDVAERPVREEARLDPLSPYAADKLAGEHYLGFYARQHRLDATAFRFFNIYGPRQDPSSPYSGVISIFSRRARENGPVTIFGDGEQTRDFVYVGDLVEVLMRALARDDLGGEVMNVGRGVECSLLELLAELERITGSKLERRHQAARSGDIRFSRASVERLRARLGYVPETPLGEGLERLVRAGG